MKTKRIDTLNILIIISFVVIGIIFLASFFRMGDPFDLILKMNYKMVSDHKLISVDKTDNGVMIYSVGKVNNGEDNMYFVDMVKKSFMGYKWIGGGGHISKDIQKEKDFILSAQLLNENHNVEPTLFGIIKDCDISKINLITNDGPYSTRIADGFDKNERFYVVSFNNSISNDRFFIFQASYTDGRELEFYISQEINSFQHGMCRYFYEEDINN